MYKLAKSFLKDSQCFLFNNCQVIPTNLASKSYTPSHADNILQDTFGILGKVLYYTLLHLHSQKFVVK